MSELSSIRVQTDKPGHAIPASLWGAFFEDINHAADGGLYPELVRNRSFEESAEPSHWRLISPGEAGGMAVVSSKPLLNSFNRHYLRIDVGGSMRLENEGYWGMSFVAGKSYRLKLAVRLEHGRFESLSVRLVGAAGNELARGSLSSPTKDWAYQTVELLASAGGSGARLEVSAEGKAALCLDMVSLMPTKTWKNHGLRPDLAEALHALKPAFFRFPGGCWVEGGEVAQMNHWKDSLGNPDSRTPLENLWGYQSTRGLGYHEYLFSCSTRFKTNFI